MTVDRRRLLGLFGVGAAAGCAATPQPPRAPLAADAIVLDGVSFAHGVASGDPDTTSVLLWTRAGSVGGGSHAVRWQVAEDESFQAIAAEGVAETSAARDHTVKVVADGLRPGTDYWYRFIAMTGQGSPVGRTRTLPEASSGDPVVLAVASCSLHPNGLFNAYDAIARLESLHAVVHLGDYIYEYGAAEGDYGMANGRRLNRIPEPPREIVTLEDYRARHAQYKSDPNLQAAHARAPWIVVYDDHEVTNDGYLTGAENHQPEEGGWAARKAAALKAYFEWMPIREPEANRSLEAATYRSFRFGRSASLHMLETRLMSRTRQLDYATDFYVPGPDGQPTPDRAGFMARLNDPARRLLGEDQLAWLERDLSAAVEAGAAWQLIGNQVVMARVTAPDFGALIPEATLNAVLATLPAERRQSIRSLISLFGQNVPLNLDAWDGYPAERERLYAALKRSGARPVALAGDSHTFWVNRLADAGGGDIGIEFGTTAITSPSPADSLGLPIAFANQAVNDANEEVRFVDFGPRGFLKLTLTPEQARGELIAVSTITETPYRATVVKTFEAAAEPQGRIGALRES